MKKTIMEKEAREAPEVVAKQLEENAVLLKTVCERVRQMSPKFVVTIGRGSSDHACTFAKYLFETYFGLATVSAAPSVLTLYGASMDVKDALVVGVSQSGKSPDICEVMRSARKGGALTLAIVNEENSPLAEIAEYVMPMLAGKEEAVAATKSYIASIASLIQLSAFLSQNKKLQSCIAALPEKLSLALDVDWSNVITELEKIEDTLVLGRGFSYPIAQEAALKFKETTNIHAESFSGAEVLHGPFAIIKESHPYLLFVQDDNSLQGMLQLAKRIRVLGGKTIVVTPAKAVMNNYLNDVASIIVPLPATISAVCDPLIMIQAFYLMIAKLAVKRGFNPDAPDNLQKITETV